MIVEESGDKPYQMLKSGRQSYAKQIEWYHNFLTKYVGVTYTNLSLNCKNRNRERRWHCSNRLESQLPFWSTISHPLSWWELGLKKISSMCHAKLDAVQQMKSLKIGEGWTTCICKALATCNRPIWKIAISISNYHFAHIFRCFAVYLNVLQHARSNQITLVR